MLPDTVQTAAVVDAKLTVRPDEAVAVTVNGAVPSTRFDKAANVIVCGNRPAVTWKLRVTGGAGAKVALPA